MLNKLFAAVAAISLLPALAYAQSAPPAEGANVGEITVTAMRRSERLQDVPISVTAQTGAQLAAAGISDTRGLQQAVPGLTFTGLGAYAEPSLRGVSTTLPGAGEESPIAIYVDGVYLLSQTGAFFQMPDVGQVEVLKGPQGTLFGRNAEGGAILITTKEPSFKAGGDLTATFGYYTGEGGSVGAPDYGVKGFLTAPLFSDKVAGSVSFLVNRTDGYQRNLVTHAAAGGIDTGTVRLKLLFEPNNNEKFLLTGYYIKTNDAINNASTAINGVSSLAATYPGGAPAYPGATIASGPWSVASDYPTWIISEAYGGSLRATWTLGDGVLTSLTAVTHAYSDDRTDPHGGAANTSPAWPNGLCYVYYQCIDYHTFSKADTLQEELVWNSRQYGPFRFTAGAFLFRSDEHGYGYFNSKATFTDERVVDTSYAVFTEGTYNTPTG